MSEKFMTYTLITGASSGIGYELAKIFARNKHNLVLVARTQNKLQALKKELEEEYAIEALVIPEDLSLPHAARDLFQKTKDLKIDILVNNAGYGDHGTFAQSDLKKQLGMIQVNVMALTELTHLYLGPMLHRKSGKIMNVASTAAFQPGPLMSVYYATKAFVLSFSEGLYEELKHSGVTVTALCPGPTLSGFQDTANFKNIPIMDRAPVPTSLQVAEYGYKALMKGKLIAVHGTMNRIMASSVRFAPRSVVRQLVMKLQEKR
jgi:short-subunit dehydrogenase